MTVKHLDHLNLSVRDLEETSAWYHRLFGFEVAEEGTSNGVRFRVLRSGEALLCIYERPELELLPAADRVAQGMHGINHFGLRITDPEAWEATVAREGVALHYGGAIRHPHSDAWYLSDPTGYTIEVAYWDHERVAFG